MTTSLFAQGPGSYEYRVPASVVEKAKQAWTKATCRALGIASERVSVSFPKENWRIGSGWEPFTLVGLMPFNSTLIDGIPYRQKVWSLVLEDGANTPPRYEILHKLNEEQTLAIADWTIRLDDPARLTYLGIDKIDRDMRVPMYRVNLVTV